MSHHGWYANYPQKTRVGSFWKILSIAKIAVFHSASLNSSSMSMHQVFHWLLYVLIRFIFVLNPTYDQTNSIFFSSILIFLNKWNAQMHAQLLSFCCRIWFIRGFIGTMKNCIIHARVWNGGGSNINNINCRTSNDMNFNWFQCHFAFAVFIRNKIHHRLPWRAFCGSSFSLQISTKHEKLCFTMHLFSFYLIIRWISQNLGEKIAHGKWKSGV